VLLCTFLDHSCRDGNVEIQNIWLLMFDLLKKSTIACKVGFYEFSIIYLFFTRLSAHFKVDNYSAGIWSSTI